ncbi:hypothetical protein OC835_007530, partial [Tilletia horrida]
SGTSSEQQQQPMHPAMDCAMEAQTGQQSRANMESDIILVADGSKAPAPMDLDTAPVQENEVLTGKEVNEQKVEKKTTVRAAPVREVLVKAADGEETESPRAIWLPDPSVPIKGRLQAWAKFEVWVNSLGQLTPGLRLIDSPTIMRPLPSSISSDSLPPFLEMDPDTQGYKTKHDVIAMMRVFGLPPEVVLMIMTAACTSQPDWINLCRGFIGRQGVVPAYIAKIGPLFFTPAWEVKGEGLRRLMPRVSDHGYGKQASVVEVCKRTLVLPEVATSLSTAVKMWQEHGWGESQHASVDVIGDRLLGAYHAETWVWGTRITPVVTRFLERATEMISLVRKATHLRMLDLRLGIWALYDAVEEAAFYFGPQQLYELTAGLPELHTISLVLDLKKWASNERHNEDLTIKVEHAIGFQPCPDSLPPSVAHKKIRFLRIVVPDAELTVDPAFLLDCLEDVTHFELVCRHLDTRVSALELLYLVAQRFGTTLETLRVVIMDDNSTGQVLSAASGQTTQPSASTAQWTPYDDDDDDSDEEFYARYQSQAAQLGPSPANAAPVGPHGPVVPAHPAIGAGNAAPAQASSGAAPASAAPVEWYKQSQTYEGKVRLPRLRGFHLECRRLDLNLFRRFELTEVTHFVMRTENKWFNSSLTPMPDGALRSVKVGALGTFTNKKEALEAYRFCFGFRHDEPLACGDFALYGRNAELLGDWAGWLNLPHTATLTKHVAPVRMSYTYEQILRREAQLRSGKAKPPSKSSAALFSAGPSTSTGSSQLPAGPSGTVALNTVARGTMVAAGIGASVTGGTMVAAGTTCKRLSVAQRTDALLETRHGRTIAACAMRLGTTSHERQYATADDIAPGSRTSGPGTAAGSATGHRSAVRQGVLGAVRAVWPPSARIQMAHFSNVITRTRENRIIRAGRSTGSWAGD